MKKPQFTTTGNLTLSQVLYSQYVTIYIQKALKKAEESTFQSKQLDVILKRKCLFQCSYNKIKFRDCDVEP